MTNLTKPRMFSAVALNAEDVTGLRDVVIARIAQTPLRGDMDRLTQMEIRECITKDIAALFDTVEETVSEREMRIFKAVMNKIERDDPLVAKMNSKPNQEDTRIAAAVRFLDEFGFTYQISKQPEGFWKIAVGDMPKQIDEPEVIVVIFQHTSSNLPDLLERMINSKAIRQAIAREYQRKNANAYV